jgi:iron complex transport system substrate-binding protein
MVAAARPEVVLAIPCGYDAARAHEEAILHAEQLARVGARRVVALDASAYFSRPGPRLVDGLELLAHVLHPDLVPAASAEVLDVEVG